jgi:hypothetical protein
MRELFEVVREGAKREEAHFGFGAPEAGKPIGERRPAAECQRRCRLLVKEDCSP